MFSDDEVSERTCKYCGYMDCYNEECLTVKHLIPEAKETSLNEYLESLQEQMKEACDVGIRGETMVQRVDGDLRRIMNSAWLNLSDYVFDSRKKDR